MTMKALLAVLVMAALPVAVAAQGKETNMRFPSPETERSISWGWLGRYVAEKSPVGDPVTEASKKMATTGAAVIRPAPAPYQKLTGTDPFENRHLLRMPGVVPEEAMPPLLLPKK
jgi:hypothetical protein